MSYDTWDPVSFLRKGQMSCNRSGLSAWVACRPCRWHIRDPYASQGPWFEMWKFIYHIVGCSSLQAYKTRKPAKKGFLMLPYWLGINLGTFSAREARLPLAHRRDCQQCCNTGVRLCHQKGLTRTDISRCWWRVVCFVSVVLRHVSKTCHLTLWDTMSFEDICS